MLPSVLRAAIAFLLVVSAAHEARAQAFVPGARDLELSLWLDNDNMLLGGWSAMVGIERDGNDFGRTHASGLSASWNLVPWRMALRLEASSELFTTPLKPVGIYDYSTIPIHFHELDRLRLAIALAHPEQPWHASIAIGADVSNRSAVTIGASGQQQGWHVIAREAGNDILWQWIYVEDGTPVAIGAAIDGAIGAIHAASLADWLHVRVRSDAGLRLSTLLAGCQTFGELELAIGAGERHDLRAELTVRQRGELWLENPNASLRTTLELAAESAILRVWAAIHWWTGDPRTAFYVHSFPNSTMTLGLTARID